MFLPEQENTPIPKKSPFKKGLKIVLWLCVGLILLLVIPVVLVWVYQKEIKQQVINELNKHLKTQVFINPDDVDFTILKTFPKAAVWFKNVTVMGSLPDEKNDTLLKAESIYLMFNAKDIWNKKYVIDQIEMRNSSLKVKVNELGEVNYEFWKSAGNADEKGNAADFKLSRIVLDDFRVLYKNYQNKFNFSSNFKELLFSGNFTEASYLLDLQGTGRLLYLASGKKKYIQNKNLVLNISAEVRQNLYTLSKAEISLNKLLFSLTGTIENTDDAMPCNLSCKGENIDIQSILSLLPEKFHDKIKDYESNGVFYAEADLQGNLQDYNDLSISSKFGIKNASITYRPLNTSLTGVNANGAFVKEKYKLEKLSLKNIEAKQNQNYVQGNLELKNFAAPYLVFDAKGKYNLQDFFSLVPMDTLAEAKGNVDFEVSAAIQVNELSSRKNDAVRVNGQLKINSIELAFKNGKSIQAPEGLVRLDDDALQTENLKLMHGNSSLQVSGKASNFLNYIFKENQKIYVDADISSPMIDLGDFIFPVANTSSDNTFEGNQKIITLNKYVSSQINFKFDKVKFNAFEAKNISGNLQAKDRKLMATNVKLEAFDGNITMNAIADNSDTTKVQINCSASLENIRIKKMFSELNNFGQQVISDKNIQGVTTAQIDFSAKWNNKLECDLSSIMASADVSIDKGELADYEPLKNLSKYIELKELQRIKFSTLKTHVDIKNKVVTFSKTEVGNSALNLDIWGTHSFTNEIDYHIKLLLSEYLAKRPGKNKQLDEELIENENDPELKRCVFLHMYGTVDNPIIKYDRKAMKQKIKQDLKEEKQTLKQLLNEEFGLFKKDTSLHKKETQQKQDQNFKIEFNQNKSNNDKRKEKEQDDEDF